MIVFNRQYNVFYSIIKDLEIRLLLQNALTDKIDDRQVFMKGIDSSYEYKDIMHIQYLN